MKALFLSIMILWLGIFSDETPVNIWLVGDSTMAWKKPERNPESGWGEGLKGLVRENARIHNHAASGRSTKSFIDEGRWKEVVDSLRKGDYVVIQFGHNDQKTEEKLHTDAFGSFKKNLKYFVEQTRERGAHPILCTSIVRRHFDDRGKVKDTHGDYILATREVAQELKVPLVDLQENTRQLLNKLGREASKPLYVFNKGRQDSTHLSHYGATEVALLFVRGMQGQQPATRKLFGDK